MLRLKSFFVPLTLFFLSFFIRLSFISKGPFHCDALELAIKAQNTLATLKLHYLYPPGSPLTVIVAAVNIAVFKLFAIDDPVLAVNFMAVYLSSLCVLILYLITKELFNGLTAILSSLFLMVLPPFLSVSLYGKNHALSLFFVLISVYLILKYLNNKRSLFLALSGIFLGLCGSVRPSDTLTIIPLLLFLTLQISAERNSPRNTIKRILKDCGLFVMMFSLPLIIFYVPYIIKTGPRYIMVFMSSPGSANRFMGIFSSMLPLAIEYSIQSLTMCGVIFSVFGLLLIFRKDKKIFLFLFSWFVIQFFYHGNLSSLSPRFLIIGLIPMVISAGYAFSELAQVSRVVRMFTLLLFFVTLLCLFDGLLPTLEFRHRYNLQKDFGSWVAGKTEKNAIIMAMDESIFIEYYAKRKTLDYPVVPITCNEGVAGSFIFEHISKNLMRGIPVYLVSSGLAYDINLCRTIFQLLHRYFILEPLGCHVNEDWHHSCIGLELYKDCLYRIREKPQSPLYAQP